MTSHSLLHSTPDVSDQNDSPISSGIKATKCSSEAEVTGDDDFEEELRDDSSLRDEAEKGAPSPANNSILGDFSLFRDFFLAAFSDGYYKVRLKQCERFVAVAHVLNQTFLSLIDTGILLWIGGSISRRFHFTASS